MNAMADVRVCDVTALDDPGRKVVEIEGQQIGMPGQDAAPRAGGGRR
jgi:hypothetical protein